VPRSALDEQVSLGLGGLTQQMSDSFLLMRPPPRPAPDLASFHTCAP